MPDFYDTTNLLLVSQMPGIEPEYLRPVVGYIMWYAGRKKRKQAGHYNFADAVELARHHPPFADITDSEFTLASEWALKNIQAGEIARTLPEASYRRATQ
jgi:hypothetical protein